MDAVERELRDKHSFFVGEISSVTDACREDRELCLQDRRFAVIPGAQWEDNLGKQFINKPRMEINKIAPSLTRIFNEYRNNRITVDFTSKDGSDADDMADFCDGLYRANEQDSNAQEAYDNAFDEGTTGGIGAWRYTTKYYDESDPEDDRQEICIEPIHDAGSCVFFDASAKRQDKSDARRGYVLIPVTIDDFVDQWGYSPDKDSMPSSVFKDIDSSYFDWVSDDCIYIAEVYEKEQITEKIYVWETPDGEEIKLSEESHKEQREYLKIVRNAKHRKTRSITKTKVHKYIISGDQVLEDCGYVAGDCIPIAVFYGKRSIIDNIERSSGHVRISKDAARIKNMQVSNLAELSSLNVYEKPIFTPEQILSHDLRWANDNVENYPYLLVDPITDINGNKVAEGPVGFKSPPQIPPAMAALLQITESDIQDLLGNQQDGERVAGNISTDTAMFVQNRIDMQTYIYMDNFASAMRHGGRIWLGMAKDIYCEDGRSVKTIGKNNEVKQNIIGEKRMGADGGTYIANDLSKVNLSVMASVGPSSSTARQSMLRTYSNMLPLVGDQQTKDVITSLMIMNMEGEGVKDAKKYFRRRLISMGVIEPNKEEKEKLQQEMENQQPNPQDQYFMAEAEKARAQAVESQADVILKQAQADKTRAQTAEVMADIDAKQQDQALEAMEKLGPSVNPPFVTGSQIEGL